MKVRKYLTRLSVTIVACTLASMAPCMVMCFQVERDLREIKRTFDMNVELQNQINHQLAEKK